LAKVGTGVGGGRVGINVGMARGGADEQAAIAAAAHAASNKRAKPERWLIPSKPSLPRSGNCALTCLVSWALWALPSPCTLFGRSARV